MAGLWRNNPKTPEGKYPIVLRRDGTPLESRFIVLALKDLGTADALRAYAAAHVDCCSDIQYIEDLLNLADEADRLAKEDSSWPGGPTSDPDAPSYRKDNPLVLSWAQTIGNPGS